MARGSNNIHNRQADVGGVTEILEHFASPIVVFDLNVLSVIFFLLYFSSLSFYDEQFIKKKSQINNWPKAKLSMLL